MIVQLPSNGLFGLRSVDLHTPRIGYVRELSGSSYVDEQLKTEFVRLLLGDKVRMDQLTLCDRDYLFALGTSAICLNEVPVDYVCPVCQGRGTDTTGSVVYHLTDQEPIFLEEGTPVSISKHWEGIDTDLTYKFLNVAEETCIIDYALGDYDHYSLRYEQAYVAGTLGYDIYSPTAITASIAKVNSYPVYVYFSVLLFGQMTFHGVSATVEGVCPVCGSSVKVLVPFGSILKGLDSASIVNRFAQLSGIIDFRSFMDLSFPELKQLESTVTSKK